MLSTLSSLLYVMLRAAQGDRQRGGLCREHPRRGQRHGRGVGRISLGFLRGIEQHGLQPGLRHRVPAPELPFPGA